MKLRNQIDFFLEKALILIMAVMVINVLWQVFSRYVTGSPSLFTDELARYLMIWVGILGAAYVSGKNMHVAIDILPQKAGPKTQKALGILVNGFIITFALVAFVIGGLRLVYITFILGQHSPALNLPLYVVYLVLPISGLLIIFYKISDILNK